MSFLFLQHLEVLNERVGPCFGLALMEKVSKIIPVPKEGSVYEALRNVVRLHKLTFESIDIRFADNMQVRSLCISITPHSTSLCLHLIINDTLLDY